MNQTEFILKCKEVRAFLIKQGGASRTEVKANVKNSDGCLTYLAVRNLAYLSSRRIWKPIEMRPVEYDIEADLSFENDD